MGKIRKILETELVGGMQTTDVYPVTSVKAVYDENNERLDHILNRRGIVNISTNYNDDHIAEVLTLYQAINKVPASDRVLGFQGKYLASDSWHTIIYTGENLANWGDKTKWIDLADKVFNSISKNATFGGIAVPTTNPDTPEGPVFYIATERGTYSNFGGINLENGETVILEWNDYDSVWQKRIIYELKSDIHKLINIRGYFTGPTTPNIIHNGDYSYNISFPEGNNLLRIYGNERILATIPVNGEEYKIQLLESLVYSLDTGEIRVVSTENKEFYDIVLFESLGTSSPFGIIAQYYMPAYSVKNSLDELQNNIQVVSYFTGADRPEFNFSEDSSIIVTLPPAGTALRIFDRKDNIYRAIALSSTRTYKIPLYSALIVDFTDNVFKVIDLTESQIQSNDTFILLFNKSIDGVCDGLLSEYFEEFLKQRNTWTIQDAMSDSTNNIVVETGKIKIQKGFSLINNIGRYAIECINDFVIRPLDDINGDRIVRTYVYIDTLAINEPTIFLDGENAKSIFVIQDYNMTRNNSRRYLLFATFYYQEPSGGLIDAYRNNKSSNTANLYDDKIVARNQCAFRSDFNCLFFSDIHANTINMSRIVELANIWGNEYVDVILNGGDTVSNSITESLSWYNTEVNNSTIDVLTAVGNHDAWTNNWVYADSVNVYNAIIAPIISKVSNVIQPANAATTGKLYYYKDYGRVRVIVIEASTFDSTTPYWDSTQNSWMQEVLENARINNLAVICLTHTPFAKSDGEIDSTISFNSWTGYLQDVADDKSSILHDSLSTIDAALANVDTFINNGGKFICWLAGHTHVDYFVKSIKHPKQVMFVTASANSNIGPDYAVSTDKSGQLYDCMTYIGIDINKMWLKLLRIGKNIDGYMRKKNVLVYDLINQKTITNY